MAKKKFGDLTLREIANLSFEDCKKCPLHRHDMYDLCIHFGDCPIDTCQEIDNDLDYLIEVPDEQEKD